MKRTKRVNESGYALLSLLVAMTLGLVILTSMAAKPSAQFSGQRENEEEAFYRAQQVSYAILFYAEQVKGGLAPQNLPTKLEDLAGKFLVRSAQGTSERYLLRKSSLIDPLTGTEWKVVRWGDPKIKEFARTYNRVIAEQQALALTSGAPGIAGAQPGAQAGPPADLRLLMMAAQAAGLDLSKPNAGDDKDEENAKPNTASGFSLDLDSDSRPIVAVMSSLKKPMIRNYYEIPTYDKAIFIAGVQIPGLNTVIPMGGGMGGQGNASGAGTGQGEPDGKGNSMRKTDCFPGNTARHCTGK